METQEHEIPGWGVDRRREDRPGYPLIQDRHVDHDTLLGQSPWKPTIVSHGLSGRIRAAAYQVPTHQARRWMLLMLADRVDALERRITGRRLLLAAGAFGGIVALVRAGRRRRRR
jgi:hypothetical protein